MYSFNNDIGHVVLSNHLSVADHMSFFQYQWEQHWTAVVSGHGTDIALVSKSGVITWAHRAILLPLSPLLTSLVDARHSCGCPEDLPTIILSDWDDKVVLSLIQLLYTGSVIVNYDRSVELVELMRHLDLRVHRDRLTQELVDNPVTRVDNGLGNVVRYQYGEQVAWFSTQLARDKPADSGTGSLLGDEMEIDNVKEGSNEQNQQKKNQSKNGSSIEGSFSCLNCKKMFPMDKPVSYVLHERSCKEHFQPEPVYSNSSPPKSRIEVSQSSDPNLFRSSQGEMEDIYNFVDCKENISSEAGKCHICEAELPDSNMSAYHHYSTVHFTENLLADFSHQIVGQQCRMCGEVVPKLSSRYWFLVHMGVLHEGVKRYLPPQFGVQSMGINAEQTIAGRENINYDVIVEEDTIRSNDEEYDWKQNSVCVICEMSLDSLDLLERGDHFHGHFKRLIIGWLYDTKDILSSIPKTCPECNVKFITKKALLKHLGSDHNLYETFLKRYMDGDHDLMPKNSKKVYIKTTKVKNANKSKSDVNENIPKSLKQKKKDFQLKQVVNKDIIKDKSEENTTPDKTNLAKTVSCQLCSKQFTGDGLLLQHICSHFSKELRQDYPEIFSKKNGEKVTCPKCNKGPMRKMAFMVHIGATHREVTKYAPWAKTDFKKIKKDTPKIVMNQNNNNSLKLSRKLRDTENKKIKTDFDPMNESSMKRKLRKNSKYKSMNDDLLQSITKDDGEILPHSTLQDDKENPMLSEMPMQQKKLDPLFTKVRTHSRNAKKESRSELVNNNSGSDGNASDQLAIKEDPIISESCPPLYNENVSSDLPPPVVVIEQLSVDPSPSVHEPSPAIANPDTDGTSIFVAWQDSDVETQVLDSTSILDPADLSQLVKSAKQALDKQGKL